MTTAIVQYDNILKNISTFMRKDELKDINDKAIVMTEYAKRAKDKKLVGISVRVRKESERQIGILMNGDREAGKLPKNQWKKNGGSATDPAKPLSKQGIDKHLADRSRRAAKMTAQQWKIAVDKAVGLAIAATESLTEIVRVSKKELLTRKQKKRREIEQSTASRIKALPDKKYGIIVADPEWRFDTFSEQGRDRQADNHYKTSPLDVIKSRKVANISAKDCILFLWGTAPMLPQALEVLQAWGFQYVTNMVWVKHKAGNGYWIRNKHEHLLIGRKGKVVPPAMGTQWSSVIEAKVGKHSQKPDEALKMIDQFWPNTPKIELNRRGPARKGWDAWGAEAE